MDTQSLLVLLSAVFLLITLPLLAVVARLRRIGRVLARIEALNIRSIQRWG